MQVTECQPARTGVGAPWLPAQIHGHRDHTDDPLFRLRRVLRVGLERLDDATVVKIFERLRAADTNDEVAAAWVAADPLRRMDARTRPRTGTLPTGGSWPPTSGPRRSRPTRSPGWPAPSTRRGARVLRLARLERADRVRKREDQSIRRAARGFRDCGNYRARVLLHAGQSNMALEK